jgi:predicted DsbA family dithiol-disulfide isomerase
MKVEIYSDVVCPWCYIGERRFARAVTEFPDRGEVEVVFRPYQLDPGAPETAAPLTDYLEKRYGAAASGMRGRVSDVAAGEGIEVNWDRALSVNTRTAHRLLRLAEREYGAEVQRALLEALFAAHFTHGGDVADHAQLTGLAASVGMDPGRIAEYLASDEGARELEAELDGARARGVTAVPTFVFDGRYVVEGAQPTAVFLDVLRQVRERS